MVGRRVRAEQLGNPVYDFWAYSVGRFKRSKALKNDPAIAWHVNAVEKR